MSLAKSRDAQDAAISCRPFGRTPSGEVVELYTLLNSRGVTARIMTYGGILQSLEIPDRDGHLANVTLGFSRLEEYIRHSDPYFGAIVGRYANRIASGSFLLDGEIYRLEQGRGQATLHGGWRGFDKRVWQAEPTEDDGGSVSLRLRLVSPDGDQGFPGNLRTEVLYTLSPDSELRLSYRASTDRATVVNLTHHGYFNLRGEGSGDILGHHLWIDADGYTPADANLIPTGEIAPVAGTPLDFGEPAAIGSRIRDDFDQLVHARGYDHNFVLNRSPTGGLRTAARLTDPGSGRVLEIRTSEPGLQLYTGNLLDGRLVGPSGNRYERFAGVALETQHFPNSPNNTRFPSTVLRPGETHESTTELAFFCSHP